jgi:hypothetical protein
MPFFQADIRVRVWFEAEDAGHAMDAIANEVADKVRRRREHT